MFLGLVISGEFSLLKMMLGSIVIIPLSIFLGYIFFSYFLVVRLFVVGIGQSSGKWGSIGSKAKFEQKMKSIIPDFSYEYFTSKAISLIKLAVYSKDEKDLLFYRGEALAPKFKDVIDLNYGGALGVTDLRVSDGVVTVITDAFFDVLYATDNGIVFKREAYKAVFQRRTDIPVNMQFSMTKIQCPTCGSSFNAILNRNCPYCGNRYDLASQDWVLVSLR
jgi:hypothetical protein